MPIITLILLYLISLFNGDRSIAGIFHLLKGKRSSQTIQDGHLYQCLFLFGVFPRLVRTDLEKGLEYLLNNHYIKQESEMTYKITKKGQEILHDKLKDANYIFYLNGWKHKDVASIFWKRLVLMVQSLSCLTVNDHYFFPVINDEQVKYWVKKNFPKQTVRHQYNRRLYEELITVLTKMSKEEAELFTYKLTGSNRIGLTNEQLATILKKEKLLIELIHLSIVHRILEELQLNRQQYPILKTFISDISLTIQMTNSTRQTYHLVKRGLSIEEIAVVRNLKVSTIEDHVVEIMLEDKSVELASFISNKEFAFISKVIVTSDNKKLSELKKQLPEEISFFKIRLVLARLGER
ncbi:helix-turn-helix domain-containing protein [Alkalihalobacterium elongatum]|uniref:helix-turn-helix domain-containing protein n=1 Tax=Alkalihalobacterium elongatum TaxID=2675466 RepID=UPI001C200692|nr:helix-turn-helix domain-containing protein [Alkalihalobacterium elongatum]